MKRCTKCGKTKPVSSFSLGHDQCKPCRAAQSRQYHHNHLEKDSAHKKAYYAEHREETKARQRAYYANHTEAAREYHKAYGPKYYKAHKAERLALYLKSKTARLQQTLRGVDQNEIKAFYLDAEWLTKETGIQHSVDHIIPLQGKAVRGLHVPWNLQILTMTDNRKKGNRVSL